MSIRRPIPIVTLAAVLACWPICAGSPAEAAFTPFKLASADPALELQAEYAYEPALSADGDYVAFTGIVGSKHGIWRKNIQNNALELVAEGVGAGAPSISADGRYVSFTTPDNPHTGVPTPSGCTQVYVRDMEDKDEGPLEPGPEAAYRLVSAANGAEEPLTYAGEHAEKGCPGGGSASAGRVALSADGNEVAFTVIGQSDLTAPCTTATNPPEPPKTTCPTPPEQVAVRNLATDSTTLVSVTLASLGGAHQPVPAGATLSGAPLFEGAPRKEGGNIELGQAASTAAISADGSTVAWMGINIADQAPASSLSNLKYADEYAEPLWRRIADGSAAPTRRVLAGEDPSCPPNCSGGLALDWDEFLLTENYVGTGPAYGSYISQAEAAFKNVDDVTPQLSEDGMKVAILSTQPNYGNLPNFGGQQALKDQVPSANAFVVNMTPGLTRAQAITRLTEWGSPDFKNSALDSTIGQIAISPDGTRVALITERVAFPLAPPVLVTQPANQAETTQLYEVNLQAGTLALVSEGYNGEPANHERGLGGVSTAALSGDGKVLALASGSTNLAFGAVSEGSDIFVTEEIDPVAVTGQQSVTALPLQPIGESGWSIGATVRPGRDGTLLLDASVPGAGRLAVSADASVPTTVAVKGRPTKTAAQRHGRRASLAGASLASRRTVTVIATRQVAHTTATTNGAGLIELRLTPATRYRPLDYGKGGLYATITVTFSAPGHPQLEQALQSSFPRIVQPAPPKKKPKAKSRTAHRSHRG